mmetsp:Transcript_38957/g.90295  ORF Transcript_38957/g.90295 Transcript_38957/m.90295 type:complete len:462 (-) Transcript_38957:57-1442(-)
MTEQAEDRWEIFVLLANLWPAFLLTGMSMGIIFPMESYIALNFFAQQYTDKSPGEIRCEVSPDAAYCKAAVHDSVRWTSISSVVHSGMSIAFGPAVGVLSDAYGRRPMIITTSALGMLPNAAQVLFVYFNVSLYLWYALLFFASIPVIGVWFALVTDLIPNPSRRAAAFGLALIAWECAMLLGMVVGALLPLRAALAVSTTVHAVNVLWQAFYLGESLPQAKRKRLKAGPLLPIAGLSILVRNAQLFLLSVIFFTSSFVGAGIDRVGSSYLQKYLAWNKTEQYVVSILGQVSTLLWVGCALQRINAAVGEVGLLRVGQVAGLVHAVAMYFMRTPFEVYAVRSVTVGAMALAFPATAALKGGLVEEHEQGHVQGAVQTAKSVAAGLGPVVFGAVFNACSAANDLTWSTGLIFLLGAAIYCVLLPLTLALPQDILRNQAQAPEQEDKVGTPEIEMHTLIGVPA